MQGSPSRWSRRDSPSEALINPAGEVKEFECEDRGGWVKTGALQGNSKKPRSKRRKGVEGEGGDTKWRAPRAGLIRGGVNKAQWVFAIFSCGPKTEVSTEKAILGRFGGAISSSLFSRCEPSFLLFFPSLSSSLYLFSIGVCCLLLGVLKYFYCVFEVSKSEWYLK